MLPVVFWAHFKSRSFEAYRMERWVEGKEPVTIVEWVLEQRNKLELENKEPYCMTNCGVIQ